MEGRSAEGTEEEEEEKEEEEGEEERATCSRAAFSWRPQGKFICIPQFKLPPMCNVGLKIRTCISHPYTRS